MRILSLIILFTFSNPGYSCGIWSINDLEDNARISFYINSAVRSKNGMESHHLFGFDYGSNGFMADRLRRAKKGLEIRQKGDKLYFANSSSGAQFTYVDHELTIGKKVYKIDVEYQEREHEELMNYKVAVYKNDELVLEAGEAMSFINACMSSQVEGDDPVQKEIDCFEEKLNDIRYRVVFYLIWRDFFDH